jgi:hypothetical protein
MRWNRLGNKITLHFIATYLLQYTKLLRCFHSFCHDFDIQRSAYGDDCAT